MDPIIIVAAGGLVQNEKNEVLFMFRRNKWDLPKGKLDKGETLEQCALREVMEETGLQEIAIGKFLVVTNHDYKESGKIFRKESHWFSMKAASAQILIPQWEEDITELRWIAEKDFDTVRQNTHPAILDVLKAGGYFLLNT